MHLVGVRRTRRAGNWIKSSLEFGGAREAGDGQQERNGQKRNGGVAVNHGSLSCSGFVAGNHLFVLLGVDSAGGSCGLTSGTNLPGVGEVHDVPHTGNRLAGKPCAEN